MAAESTVPPVPTLPEVDALIKEAHQENVARDAEVPQAAEIAKIHEALEADLPPEVGKIGLRIDNGPKA